MENTFKKLKKPHLVVKYKPSLGTLFGTAYLYSLMTWEEITEDLFQEIFKKSAVKRAKFSGLTRNINFLKI